MEGHSFETLKAHILPLSVSKNFDAARKEWSLIAIEISEEFDKCPCGQDIKEHCYIRNRNLTAAQIAWKVKINRRIVDQTVVRKRTAR